MELQYRDRLIGMCGNFLEHYDNALFGLLAPFLAPLFFEKSDPLTALILTYCMIPCGFLARPLGSLFFGWIGDCFGRTRALSCSLIGMAVASVTMGCLPVYADVGYFAPLFLALGRILQNFCAAGETVGGAIYVLERTDQPKRNLMSGIYDSSTIAGILLASAFVTFLAYRGSILELWRVLFWIGGMAAVIGIFLRFKAQEGPEFAQSPKRQKGELIALIKKYQKPLIAILCVSGFSHTTFFLAFTLMNGFVPLVTDLSQTAVIGANTALLFVDMLLLPVFGYLASKIGREKLMFSAAMIAAFSAVPLFCGLKEASLSVVLLIRLILMSLGVAFSATYHAWSQEQVPAAVRYTILSLGYALGSQLIGAPTAALSLWLFKKTGWVGAPAFYLIPTAALAAFFMRKSLKPFIVREQKI